MSSISRMIRMNKKIEITKKTSKKEIENLLNTSPKKNPLYLCSLSGKEFLIKLEERDKNKFILIDVNTKKEFHKTFCMKEIISILMRT